MDLVSALWSQRSNISASMPRLMALRDAVNFPRHLDFGTWVQLYALCMEGMPDLILELGRAHGNSTCIFTEVANQLGKTTVISISNDSDRTWETATVPRLKAVVPAEWFRPLRTLWQDIRDTDFAELLAPGKNIYVFWDVHGETLASYLLGGILPCLHGKKHLVVVHDIMDAGCLDLDPSYAINDRPSERWLGDLVSPFGELIPIYDFLSRNRIVHDTPLGSIQRSIADSRLRPEELIRFWGGDFPKPTPLQASCLTFFDLNARCAGSEQRQLFFPRYTRASDLDEEPQPTTVLERTREMIKGMTPKPIWEMLRLCRLELRTRLKLRTPR